MHGYLAPTKKIRISDLAKGRKTPWAMLTAYDYLTAQTLNRAGIEVMLVGDSAANVVLGYDSTNRITLQEMITLTAAVVRGAGTSLVVADLPFGTYEASDEQAVRSATELVHRTGADMVKLEGGVRMASRIRAIVNAGVPVCAHIGFTPQSVAQLGGFKVQGRGSEGADQLRADVDAVAEAGASMVVFEMVPAAVAAELTKATPIPTIGIGAGPDTDAQVLVWQDMAGLPDDARSPRFVRRFGEVGAELTRAATEYRLAVESGEFPAPEHTF